MLLILSPSKTIDTNNSVSTNKFTQPCFLDSSTRIISKIKKITTSQLSSLMSISPKLSQLNYDRFQHWNLSHNLSNSKQALLSFKGEVFNGLDVVSFSEEDLLYSQNHLIILSGLYGLLRPLDLIQPYRLEISTKLGIQKSPNLYAYWQNIITQELNKMLANNNTNILVNLASNEYYKVIDKKKLRANIVTPVFKERKGSEYKIVTVYVKKARGLMANYILKNKINKIDDLKFFDKDGYYYNDIMSDANQLVFTRG